MKSRFQALADFKAELISERVYPLFLAGLVLKLILGSLFASSYMTELFAPFVNFFVDNLTLNPYFHFIPNQSVLEPFPYPAMMLYIMAIPRLLFGWLDFDPNIGFFDLFIYRLPLLLADLAIFAVLTKWLRGNLKRLVWFYWLSPVLIYINYLHGQLDVVPIALLFFSLLFLFKNSFLLAMLFLGLSVATKTHILMTVPFFVIYMASKRINIKGILLPLVIFAFTFLVVNIPFLGSDAFFEMVFNNQQQGKVFISKIKIFDQNYFYLIPACYFLLFLKSALLKFYNRNVFLMFLGFSFGIILLFVSPNQGWYYWLIPFLSFFYSKEKGRSYVLFMGLQGLYLLYFLISEQSDYLQIFQVLNPSFAEAPIPFYSLKVAGVNTPFYVDIVLTLMMTTLLTNCIWIYQKGIQNYYEKKLTSKPYLIGIAGDSGAGKTTLSNALETLFMKNNTSLVRGDDMHRWERGHDNWKDYTHLNPKANNLHSEFDFFNNLKNGKKIYRSEYNHQNGKFDEEKVVDVNKVIIFEGLHSFYLGPVRKMFDLKIFLKPDRELMKGWKVERDMKKRGHSQDKILGEIDRRENDSKQFIDIQEQHADITIEIAKEQEQLVYQMRFPNSITFNNILDSLGALSGVTLNHDYQENDKQVISIRGDSTGLDLEALSKRLIPGLDEIGVYEPVFPQGNYGIVVLLLVYFIFEEVKQSES